MLHFGNIIESINRFKFTKIDKMGLIKKNLKFFNSTRSSILSRAKSCICRPHFHL